MKKHTKNTKNTLKDPLDGTSPIWGNQAGLRWEAVSPDDETIAPEQVANHRWGV